jgi:hypothetical protein
MRAPRSRYECIPSMGDELGKYVDQWVALVDGKIVGGMLRCSHITMKRRREWPNPFGGGHAALPSRPS